MRRHRMAMALAVAFPIIAAAQEAPVKSLGVVTVTGGQPTSLPTQIPTTMEGVSRAQIEHDINATDSEDAVKYLPSLLVRKRYIGDYNHAIVSSRASGTGNSARSAVYADGLLLSNYLGNGVGGLSFPPRWGLVTPEEIDRVDVMYGPFSAAYPGNSVGAVIEYVTRLPKRFVAHGKLGLVSQPFDLYGTHITARAWQASASAGNQAGAEGQWAWWFNVNRTDSQSQPLTFTTRALSSGTPGSAGVPVSGAVADANNANRPIYVLGTGTQYHTRQDHLKAKLALELSPAVRASYTLGLWTNQAEGRPASLLRDSSGRPVYDGTVNIEGRAFAPLTGADFVSTRERLTHSLHGLSIKSHTQSSFDWELAASLYDYLRDDKRQSGANNVQPAAATGGAGTLANGAGTGWNTLALKGIWRPAGAQGQHIVDFGFQQERYRLKYLTSNMASDWTTDAAGAMASRVGGRARLQSLYAQDAWAFATRWKTVLGGRVERWTASQGLTEVPGATPAVQAQWPERRETHFSPKAALSYQWARDTVLKASIGRAVRMPTVGELYGATSTSNSQYINDPLLKPEKSWTAELSAEKDLGASLLRLTFFAENTRDSLYSQTTFDALANRNISRVQNIARIQTRGLELSFGGSDVALKGMDLTASLTYADSVIKENAGFVSAPGDTLGKRQPNIPRWRATALASYRWDAKWTSSLGARYSGRQFRTLDNSDVNGFTYQGVSKYFTVDWRARYQISKTLSAAIGIDNLNNYKFWNFHPYPQRSYVAELKADL